MIAIKDLELDLMLIGRWIFMVEKVMLNLLDIQIYSFLMECWILG